MSKTQKKKKISPNRERRTARTAPNALAEPVNLTGTCPDIRSEEQRATRPHSIEQCTINIVNWLVPHRTLISLRADSQIHFMYLSDKV